MTCLYKNFMDTEILISEGVIRPREITEILGIRAVQILSYLPYPGLFIDMCCGSGNLACGIAKSVPNTHGWAVDISLACVELARENVKNLRLEDRLTVLQGSLFKPLAPLHLIGTIDVIVCNPPYVARNKLTSNSVFLQHNEPLEAFDGGEDGLAVTREVITGARPFLRREGLLIFEMGFRREKIIENILRDAGYTNVEFIACNGGPRMVSARKEWS